MRALKEWYQEHCEPNDPLVIIITDFESSPAAVLHDFILILRYCNSLDESVALSLILYRFQFIFKRNEVYPYIWRCYYLARYTQVSIVRCYIQIKCSSE